MNNRGFILSTYIYFTLTFFLLMLVVMVMLLDNTRLLANKIKKKNLNEQTFNLVLKGEKEVVLKRGKTFIDPGVIATSFKGEELDVKVTSNINKDVAGEYTVTYKATYGSDEQTVTRLVKVEDDLVKCKRATSLHKEICTAQGSDTDGNRFCGTQGYNINDEIIYGNQTTTNGVLNTGDAFDCDVDGTGYNKRFYFVTDVDNDSDVAVLFYSNNVNNGDDGNKSVAWGETSTSNPVNIISNLPTSDKWSNLNRLFYNRKLYYSLIQRNDENIGLATDSVLKYNGTVARLLNDHEISRACGNTKDVKSFLTNKSCEFLLENTGYNNGTVGGTYWLENVGIDTFHNTRILSGYIYVVNEESVYSKNIRPAIELNKEYIDY